MKKFAWLSLLSAFCSFSALGYTQTSSTEKSVTCTLENSAPHNILQAHDKHLIVIGELTLNYTTDADAQTMMSIKTSELTTPVGAGEEILFLVYSTKESGQLFVHIRSSLNSTHRDLYTATIGKTSARAIHYEATVDQIGPLTNARILCDGTGTRRQDGTGTR